MSESSDWKSLLGSAFSISTEEIENEVRAEKSAESKKKVKLRVAIDKRNRSGKMVTVVSGFAEGSEEIEPLAKVIKKRLGTGGSVKYCEIVVQGDLRDKILSILIDEGYTSAKKM